MSATLHITVLMGGPSAEHDVSMRTGTAVAQALERMGHQVTPLVIEGTTFVLPAKTELAFICLHGAFGEDGQVQAILEQQGCAYTGCGIGASRLAFDKAAAKAQFTAKAVPTPHGQVWQRGESVTVMPPLVIKPACQGSSFGLQFVNNVAELEAKLEQALQYGQTQIIESLVVGRELTVGILGEDVLPVVEIKPKSGHYDYATKYTPGATDYTCPAALSAAVTERVQSAALAAHRALGCTVYSRVDVMLDQEENPWVLEVNTIPGMTATSLLPKAAQAAGLSFDQLCQKIVELSLAVKREAS